MVFDVIIAQQENRVECINNKVTINVVISLLVTAG